MGTRGRQAGKAPGRFRGPVAILAIAAVCGCGQVMDGEVGLSIFAIDNSSADTIVGVYAVRGHERRALDTTPAIPPGAALEFHEESAFGANPRPGDALQSLAILRLRDSVVLLRQEPILDSLWTSSKVGGGEYGTMRFLLRVP